MAKGSASRLLGSRTGFFGFPPPPCIPPNASTFCRTGLRSFRPTDFPQRGICGAKDRTNRSRLRRWKPRKTVLERFSPSVPTGCFSSLLIRRRRKDFDFRNFRFRSRPIFRENPKRKRSPVGLRISITFGNSAFHDERTPRSLAYGNFSDTNGTLGSYPYGFSS